MAAVFNYWEEKGISTKGADSGQEEWEEDAEGKEIIKEKKEKKKIFLPHPIPTHPKSTLQFSECSGHGICN